MRKSAPLFCALLLSLSARRAWIEILKRPIRASSDGSLSARRAWIEIWSRDFKPSKVCWSLSARRAWIEMRSEYPYLEQETVALRKESVDRNATFARSCARFSRSLSARRAWIEIIECSYHNIKLESRSPQGERG